jgi:hypothetical protein
MKKMAFVVWLVLRATRWLCYIGFLAYAYYFEHHLRSTKEAWLFGLGVGGIFVGFLELMMREKAGIARPYFFQLMPSAAPPQSEPHGTRLPLHAAALAASKGLPVNSNNRAT